MQADPPAIEIRKRTSGSCRVQIPAAAHLSITSKLVLSVNQGGNENQVILSEKTIGKERQKEGVDPCTEANRT